VGGAALGGEAAGLTNLVDQIPSTGSIDAVELGTRVAQGAALGAFGGRAQSGAAKAGSGLAGQAASVLTAQALVGATVVGGLEGVNAAAHGNSFGSGFAAGYSGGVAGAYMAGPLTAYSPMASALVGVAVGTFFD
tara:strand:+ start:853 stop:1257 length:405 start_codon:yes stop_codon:yes gene_type:complete